MKKTLPILIFLFTALSFLMLSCAPDGQSSVSETTISSDTENRILVFSKTEGFRHDAIEAGQDALRKLGEANNVAVTVTENSEMFNPDSLSMFDAVVFLNTTATIFNDNQRIAFEEYIQNGGGYVGVHSASDTEYEWPWYGELVGAYFDNHPPGTPNANVLLQDENHLSTEMLPEVWNRDDEWYNYQGFSENINVLLTLDTDSYEGSDHPGNHPIAWYHSYDGGRAFYTGLGHTIASYEEELFLSHLWGGIRYAMDE